MVEHILLSVSFMLWFPFSLRNYGVDNDAHNPDERRTLEGFYGGKFCNCLIEDLELIMPSDLEFGS